MVLSDKRRGRDEPSAWAFAVRQIEMRSMLASQSWRYAPLSRCKFRYTPARRTCCCRPRRAARDPFPGKAPLSRLSVLRLKTPHCEEEFCCLLARVLHMDPIGGSGSLSQAYARTPLLLWPNGSGRKAAAAVGADVVEHVLDAVRDATGQPAVTPPPRPRRVVASRASPCARARGRGLGTAPFPESPR